jgi:dihydrofolate reductase
VKNLIWLADMSMNGFMSGPNGELDWAGANMDDQSWKDVFELLNTVDAALFGRVTYKDFENYWLSAGTNPETPKNERDFSAWITESRCRGQGQLHRIARWRGDSLFDR